MCRPRRGRRAAATRRGATLHETNPDLFLTASTASPRVRAMFDQTRRRVLPAVVRRVYTDAKRAYDAGVYSQARDGFTQLSQLLSDPQVASADPAFTDLGTLTDGFLQLSRAAIDRRSSRRDHETVQAALAGLQPNPAFLLTAPPLAAPLTPPAPSS